MYALNIKLILYWNLCHWFEWWISHKSQLTIIISSILVKWGTLTIWYFKHLYVHFLIMSLKSEKIMIPSVSFAPSLDNITSVVPSTTYGDYWCFFSRVSNNKAPAPVSILRSRRRRWFIFASSLWFIFSFAVMVFGTSAISRSS